MILTHSAAQTAIGTVPGWSHTDDGMHLRADNDRMKDEEVTQAWLSLPRRIYLDTSILQKLYDFGGVIFDGEPFEPVGRAARSRG